MSQDAEGVSSADFPETKSLSDVPAPADPPRRKSAKEPVRIKTREVVGERCDCPQMTVRQRSSSTISSAQSVSEKQTHLRTEAPKIKTRESLHSQRRVFFGHGIFGSRL